MIPFRKITEIEMIGVYDYVHHFVGANTRLIICFCRSHVV